MFYLISQYIWWLVAALLIGLVVGWATCARNPDRRWGWLWPVLIGAAVAFLVSWLRFVNGVPALWIETALLFLGTYLAGCCIGCMLKSAFTADDLQPGGVREWHRNLDAPGPGITGGGDFGGLREWNKDLGTPGPLTAAPVAAPGPVRVPVTGDELPPGGVRDWHRDLGQEPPAARPAPEPAPVMSAPSADPAPMPKVEGEDQIAGSRPVGFVSPRGGKADDLKLIRGIGRQNEGRLHGLGIWHFDQIAAWTKANVEWVGSYLAFPGRIDREQWVSQAKQLAAGKETEFAKRVKWGQVATSLDDGSQGQGNVEKLEPLRKSGGSAPPPKDKPKKG